MNYVGCLVSLNCGDVLGVYQGQVCKVDNSEQAITLCMPFRNGVQCEFPEVTISACDIKELRIVKSANEARKIVCKSATPSKLSKETAEDLDAVASPGRVVEARLDTGNPVNGTGYGTVNNTKDRQDFNKCRSDNSLTPSKDRLGAGVSETQLRRTPTRDRNGSVNNQGCQNGNRDRYDYDVANGNRYNRQTPTKDEQFRTRIEFKKNIQNRQDCFSAPVDSYLDEFDFEKNLKLFDKKAVFEEIENNNPELINIDKKPEKYRHDENVLQSKPVQLQRIKVPKEYGASFTTDSGLVVPSIDYELRNKLFDIADAYGFSVERRLEMIGRSSSEMVLQLLGGSNRLNPQNGHQLPTVLVLCGPHVQGAQGLNCARHLVNHGVRTIVFLPNFLRMIQAVELELRLYETSNGKRYSMEKDIPTCSIDMIVNCLDSHENSFLKDQSWYQSHVRWVKHSRAQVFTIDPPIENVDILPKWCLYPVLPLARLDMTSQVYLCDLGIPKNVFKDAGVTYRSPFGHKFIIPLHLQS
ncbi:EDC3-like protein [Mya arenaria]|uniref:Enhancer of mRNA-decapping protein 3 n=1 Tax=Mya arenaria TaxID=6604 RepID=A0ABY7DVP0_MYAAR|nr:EDC3-like protein [Mya arenaria]